MFSAHCRVAFSAAKLKSFSLTTQPTSGGSNSIILCHDIVITLELPLWEVVSSTTGPGSSSPYTLESASERLRGGAVMPSERRRSQLQPPQAKRVGDDR